MSDFRTLGLRWKRRSRPDEPGMEQVVSLQPLRRVLAFRGRSIDDIVNDPIVKSEIFGYFKLQKQIERTSETIDLERQWNAAG